MATNEILRLTKSIALKLKVDLAIPNCEGSGVGNALMYTRLVEEYSRHKGRRLNIFTGPLDPTIGKIKGEDEFAIWRNNPFIAEIVNGYEVAPESLRIVNEERQTLIQLNHIIENICWAYGLRPRELRSSLFLSANEMSWALDILGNRKRPLVCLHPGGNTKSHSESPWHSKNWKYLVDFFNHKADFIQVGSVELGDHDLEVGNPGKLLRETMALIWASDIFIGFDSSPMHIATAFKKPVISLFDMRRKYEAESAYSSLHIPSVMLRWSYPFNRNIAIMENDFENQSLRLVKDELERLLLALTYNI